MRVQIRTLQVPKRGAGAFLPIMTPIATANSAGQNQAGIYGCPGTMRIPSPRPTALNDFGLGGPNNQPSSCAPDFFLPSIYYARVNRSLEFPGKISSDNVLPVPAQNPGRSPAVWSKVFRTGGRTATSAIRPFTQWPTYNGGSN